MKKIDIGIFIALICISIPSLLSAQMTWYCTTDSAGWSPRDFHASVVFDGKMWVMGGRYDYHDVWYSTDGSIWIQAADSTNWGRREAPGSVVFDDQMWIIGGGWNFGPVIGLNDVWHSTDGINWILATDSANWSGRFCHTSIVFDNKMWVIGGCSRNGYFNNEVWYSTDGVNWVQATTNAQWSVRRAHTSVVFDNKIWVMGGYPCTNDVWNSADGINWNQATSNAQWSARFSHTSVVFENKMWVIGGANDSCSFNDVWFSTDGAIWTQAMANAEWAPRYGHSSVVYDNKIWVIGSGPTGCDVWFTSGLGIEEDGTSLAKKHPLVSTVLCGSPVLPKGKKCLVFDIAGRRVEPAQMSPGIYFIEIEGNIAQKVIKVK